MSAAWRAASVVLLAAAVLRVDGRAPVGIERLVAHRLRAPRRVAHALADAGVTWSPPSVWTGWCAAASLSAAVGLVVGGVGLAVVVVAVVVGAPVLAWSCRRGRAERLVDDALPDVLDAVARSLRTGATLPHALREGASTTRGRVGLELGALVAEVDAGTPLASAIDAWVARCPTRGVRLVGAALSLSAETGGAAARALDGVATTMRADAALVGELRAQSSQARLSGVVIALAPFAFGIVAMGTDRRTADFLLRSRLGLGCLVVGLALDAVAAWWMQRITAAVG